MRGRQCGDDIAGDGERDDRPGDQPAAPHCGQNFAEAGRSVEQDGHGRVPSPAPHWPQNRLPGAFCVAQAVQVIAAGDGAAAAGAVGA